MCMVESISVHLGPGSSYTVNCFLVACTTLCLCKNGLTEHTGIVCRHTTRTAAVKAEKLVNGVPILSLWGIVLSFDW